MYSAKQNPNMQGDTENDQRTDAKRDRPPEPQN